MDIWLCVLQADLDGEAIWSRYERQPPPCRCSQAARTTPSLLVTSLCWPCHLFRGVPDAAGTQVSHPQGFKLEPVVAYLNGCSFIIYLRAQTNLFTKATELQFDTRK